MEISGGPLETGTRRPFASHSAIKRSYSAAAGGSPVDQVEVASGEGNHSLSGGSVETVGGERAWHVRSSK